jgi:hypothetical protein
MTTARQQKKARWLRRLRSGLVVLAALGPIWGPVRAAEDRIVVDPNSGLALSGADPVAYFTDGKPVFGRPELEVSEFGTVWRFRNAGNKAAFIAHPEVYRPQFGGYDPVAIGRGLSVRGHPLIWSVTGERLYLFYSEADRAAFLAEPDRIIAAAERRWPDVSRTAGR